MEAKEEWKKAERCVIHFYHIKQGQQTLLFSSSLVVGIVTPGLDGDESKCATCA